LSLKRSDCNDEIEKNEKILREKQKEYEITASDQNIELFNSIKNHNRFNEEDIKSTLN